MNTHILVVCVAACAGGNVAFAQNAVPNPTYSTAVFLHRDPQEFLAEQESKLHDAQARSLPALTIAPLAYAAKAALEAGENQKAHDYAVKALALADDLAADMKKRGSQTPRSFAGIPTADYYSNFVLGRLAILRGDIRSAEQYLIASGKAAGDAALGTYGPNLSLALELLKHGDEQSWQVVLRFIDEIKVFWKITPAPFDEWSSQIVAGKVPHFQAVGPTLYR